MAFDTNSLSFRTWELLYIKLISRVVDDASVDKPQAMDEVKRLINSFLPLFPDECRLVEVEVLEAIWCCNKEEGDDVGTHRLKVKHPRGKKGEPMWVSYGGKDDRDSIYFLEKGSGSDTGIARVVPLSDPCTGSKLLVKILDVIPFERFCFYFQGERDDGRVLKDLQDWHVYPNNHLYSMILSNDDETVVRLYFDDWTFCHRLDRFDKQVNGTWSHFCKKWYKNKDVNIAGYRYRFMSEEEVGQIIKHVRERWSERRESNLDYWTKYFD